MSSLTHILKLSGELQFAYTEGDTQVLVSWPDSEWGPKEEPLDLTEYQALLAFLLRAENELGNE